jgi:hypothetical protein
MATSRRTWCRVCGVELRLPWWRALVGLDHAVCDDATACAHRFAAKRQDAILAGQRRTARERADARWHVARR